MSKTRIEWADYAKGIAIIMVVIHHVVVRDTSSVLYNGTLDYLNNLFQTVRMPLFFFVSGMFIHKTINSDFKFFFKFKFIHLIYLFALWSLIRYMTVTVPEHLLLGGSDESWSSIIYIFIEPHGMLWFIYALAIFLLISWLTSSIPVITLSFSLIFFVLNIQNPVDNAFVNNLVQYYPFYLLGYLISPTAREIANNVKAYHLFVPAIFIAIMVATYNTAFSDSPLGIFVLSCGGILTGIIIASYMTKFKGLQWLGFIGKNTLPIYLMHYFPIGVLRVILAPILPYPIVTAIIIFAVALITPLIAARLFNKIGFNWLLNSPFGLQRESMKLKQTS